MNGSPLSLKLPDTPRACYFSLHLWLETRYLYPGLSGWSIYQEQSISEIRVRFRYYRGLGEPEQPVPSEELLPDQAAIRELIDRGKTITIPVIGVKDIGGKDGALCGIVFRSPVPGGYNTLEWFFRGPHQWRELTDWYNDFYKFLKDLSPPRDS